MAVTYSAATKTARMTAVLNTIDGAATAGKLLLGTTGMATTLCTITLTDPCGTVLGATLTLDLDPDIEAVAVADGDLAAAIITDGDGTTVISGLTVGTSSADIIVDSVSVVAGQTVKATAGSFTHA